MIRLARSWLGRRLVRWGFTKMSFAIPVKRLRETETLMAFHHPQPDYPVHILLVAKRPYADLLDVPSGDAGFLHDLLETSQDLVREFELEETGYRLITNGGAFQDIPHLHFHLIAERENA